MKKYFLSLLSLLFFAGLNAQSYNFSGSMSRDLLCRYLDRSITMQHMVDDNAASAEYIAQVNMLSDINARFIGRVCGLWGHESRLNSGYFTKIVNLVSTINSSYASKGLVKPIIQGAIFEYVTDQVNSVRIPNYVLEAYGQPSVTRYFNRDLMLYPPPAVNYIVGEYPGSHMDESLRLTLPDITQLETQMWFYFLATQYINSGCEALHMGQALIMNRRDVGNQIYWQLLSKIRLYASGKNRGIVLCDAHTSGMYYEPSIPAPYNTINGWQSYRPVFNDQKELLWDFHSDGLWYTKTSCTPTEQKVKLEDSHYLSKLNKSLGGKNPLGWYNKHSPILHEYDNAGADDIVGCANTDGWSLWGWDAITWFGLQSSSYRNEILKYTYYKIKCIDPNAFLQVAGMRGISPGGGTAGYTYRAMMGYQNQQNTIRDVWDGVFSSGSEFVHHNFTEEEVVNPPTPPHASSSLIFVGNDKAYYIATDGYIHAYIKDNGATGIWRTTSPSYVAAYQSGTSVTSQVKALSDLVASPDGKTLLYKGVDGYIYGFNIIDAWLYSYFEFPKSQMIAQSLKVDRDILFSSNSRVFYIGNELSNGVKRIHGFIKSGSTWLTTSPSHASSMSAWDQTPVSGALTYDPWKNRLYYVGTDGFLYYYNILTDWTFSYVVVPKADLIAQNLRMDPTKLAVYKDRVYYIGKELINNKYRIHALFNISSSWGTFSPSHSANSIYSQDINSQLQPSVVYPNIAINSDGTTLSYVGSDLKVYYLKNLGASIDDFKYFITFGHPVNGAARNSLQFKDDKIFYVAPVSNSPSGDNRVHYFSYQEPYCGNSAIKNIEPNFNYATTVINVGNDNLFEDPFNQIENTNLLSSTNSIEIFPNPAQDRLSVKTERQLAFTIINVAGIVMLKGTTLKGYQAEFIDISSLKNGVYLIRFDGINESKKFSVVK